MKRKGMTIRNKLIIASVIIILLFSVMGTAFIFGYRFLTHRGTVVSMLDQEMMYLQMMLRGINEVILTEGTPSSARIAREGAEGFERVHNSLIQEIDDPSLQETIQKKVDIQWKNIREGIKPFLVEHAEINPDLLIGYGGIITKADVLLDDVKGISKRYRDVINVSSGKARQVEMVMMIVIAGLLVWLCIHQYFFYHFITSPIKEVAGIVSALGDGDFSVTMDESGRDEFSALASDFNQAINKINSFLFNILSRSLMMSASYGQLSSIGRQTADSTGEQTSITARAATAMEKISTSINEVSESTT